MAPRPGLTLDRWGPAAWNTLHVFAHTSPEAPSPAEQRRTAAFLRDFGARLPCPRCRAHFADFLERRLAPPGALASRARLVALLNDAHNDVNARNGRRAYSYAEHCRVYRRPPPRLRAAARLERLVALLLLAATVALTCRRRRKKFSPAWG
jgi:hypothetical protein